VLESDALRPIFSPHPTYTDEERDIFYSQLVYVGTLLIQHGVPVIFDATANRRRYREHARKEIPRFLEVYVECPLETCMARDPKGIYHRGREGKTTTIPGLQAPYERPEAPEVIVCSDQEAPERAASRIINALRDNQLLTV
jgi:adenylylsulfate kinase